MRLDGIAQHLGLAEDALRWNRMLTQELLVETWDNLAPIVIPVFGGIGTLGEGVAKNRRFGSLATGMLALVMLLEACSSRNTAVTPSASETAVSLTAPPPTPTKTIENASPKPAATSTEVVVRGYGGAMNEVQRLCLTESKAGKDMIGAFNNYLSYWQKYKVFGPGTSLSYVPVLDRAFPDDPEKCTIMAEIYGDPDYAGFFVSLPLDQARRYMATGDPDQLLPPQGSNVLEQNTDPARLSKQVGEGSAPALAGIPIGARLEYWNGAFVYVTGDNLNPKVVGKLDAQYQWKAVAEVNAPPFSPELVAALEQNGLSVSPEDICLWEATPEAVQCLSLNPEAVPELADNLREMTNTVAWLNTWDKKNKRPGQYPTLASYEAMLKAQPLQKAMDVPVIWHPESADIDPTAALWQKASELTGPDGERVGNEVLIDMSQVGLELVDWESVKDEGGWTAMGGGPMVKQGLEPVEGQAGTFRLTWRVAIGITKTEAIAKYGNVEEQYGLLPPDPTLTLEDNVISYNQSFNWLNHVIELAKNDPKTSFMNSGKGIIFAKKGVELNPEIMGEMKDGVEFFVAGE